MRSSLQEVDEGGEYLDDFLDLAKASFLIFSGCGPPFPKRRRKIWKRSWEQP